MKTLEIIGVAIGVVATVLGGVWFMITRAMSFGEARAILNDTADITKQNAESIKSLEAVQQKNEISISEIKEISKQNTESIKLIEKIQLQNNISMQRIERLPCEQRLTDISILKSIVVQKFPSAATLFSLKFSPRRLNDLGIKVMGDIKGDAFIEEHKELFFDIIDKNNPLAALDVEQFSYAALLGCGDREIFNEIKRYIYNSPSLTLEDGGRYDLSLPDVCYILSLPLRDLYLKEHPELL